MDQLREGMQEMRSRYVRKEQEVAQKDAVIRDQAATIKKLEEAGDSVSLSSPISRRDDELDELRSEIFTLEKEMDKSKKQLASVKTLHRAEIETLEQEKESARFQLTKKVKALEDELERVQDELGTMVNHQNLLEEKVAKLSSKTDYQGVINRLQLDVKQKTVLLLDAESMLEQRESDSSNKLLVRQLKIQVEEAGAEVVTGLRARKNLELELADTNAQMEEVSAARAAIEGRFLEQVRENARLSSQVGEQEEELTQLMKQYRASAGNVATYMITLQEQAVMIQSLEMERDAAREEAAELRARISVLEDAARESRNLKDGERREGELMRRLELEETNRKRAETRVIRLLEELEDGGRKRAEDDRKGTDAEKRQRKLIVDFRKLQEENAALQVL
jgi:chromosome segregation ATPase